MWSAHSLTTGWTVQPMRRAVSGAMQLKRSMGQKKKEKKDETAINLWLLAALQHSAMSSKPAQLKSLGVSWLCTVWVKDKGGAAESAKGWHAPPDVHPVHPTAARTKQTGLDRNTHWINSHLLISRNFSLFFFHVEPKLLLRYNPCKYTPHLKVSPLEKEKNVIFYGRFV